MKAFPNMIGEKGMDLRDYFAAQAMQQLIEIFKDYSFIDNSDERREAVAIAAYKQADAMLKARKHESA